MGMIGNTPYQGIIQTGNIQDGAITGPKISAAAAILEKLGYTPVNKAGDTMSGDLTGTGTVNTGSTTGAHHKINGTFDGTAMSRHGTQAVLAGNWSGAGGWGLGSGGGHTIKFDQVSGTNPYDFQGASDIELQLGSNRKVSHTGTEKRGLDFTGNVIPKKCHHDFMWYQFAGTLTPGQVPIYCADIDAAEKLAVWYIQKLYNELKSTENDSVWDGSHNALQTASGVFTKIVSGGGSAPPSGAVDYDNSYGAGSVSIYNPVNEWFEVVIGANATQIFTMSCIQVLNADTPTYPTRLIYQITRNAADWRTDYPSWTIGNASQTNMSYAPKCTARSQLDATISVVGIMLYPVTLELNF